MQTVPNIDRITSYSRPGTAVINVYLQDTVPVKEIKQRWLELRNIVNDGKGDLPDGALGPFFNDRFDDVYGNIYAVTSDSFSYEEMRVVAENIKDKFFQIPDVKKVELVGVRLKKSISRCLMPSWHSWAYRSIHWLLRSRQKQLSHRPAG